MARVTSACTKATLATCYELWMSESISYPLSPTLPCSIHLQRLNVIRQCLQSQWQNL